MKVSDYIVRYLIDKGVDHVFGYPGGMITHFIDSLNKYKNQIKAHLAYHEQGASFAACGYAQSTGKMGVAYATSGPGATNMVTGICNAYFDSIPTLFITGQVNTFETKGEYPIRQRGFQETNIVSIVESVTKLAVRVTDPKTIGFYLDKAFEVAFSDRPGPVLLDIPMDVFRADVEMGGVGIGKQEDKKTNESDKAKAKLLIRQKLSEAKRPLLLVGNGVRTNGSVHELNEVLQNLNIPIVSTMLAVDAVSWREKYYGFIGAYGHRTANFLVEKCDLLITLGARLDIRQVGAKREMFAPLAKILRVDIDENELMYKVHDGQIDINLNLSDAICILKEFISENTHVGSNEWNKICDEIRDRLQGIDELFPNRVIQRISEIIPEDSVITTDVGQNQVWVAQSFKVKQGQRIYFSGGHGAMGYSLPAAIGCAFACEHPVYCFTGDGGIQMNIQELQMIVREKLPVQVVLLNNNSLGMIRHFQEMYFDKTYVQTVPEFGYTNPDFGQISKAYGIPYKRITSIDEIDDSLFERGGPCLVEVFIPEKTYVFPKIEYGKRNSDQEPKLDRDLYRYLDSL